MSKTTKKKHVTREVLNDLTLPEDKQEIVKVFIFHSFLSII
jgi:hypothetical protein